MSRSLSSRNLFSKVFKLLQFEGIWKMVMGEPEDNGIWLIYGKEKHGKTFFSIKFADYLTQFGKVEFISAEEGLGANFRSALIRAGIDETSKVKWREYTPIPEVRQILEPRQAPKFIVLDNATIYQDELKYGELKKLIKDFSKTVFIIIAHEEKNEPYTATAKVAKKLAKIIIKVEGLACFVSGRCPGGIITIDDKVAQLYHGHKAVQNE